MFCFIDTAATGCHIAFADHTGIVAQRSLPIERGHAEALMPLYEECLADTGKTANDIEQVFVTVGPGSFTGLRVGLTVARFIGFTLSVPVHGITMFQAFSAGVTHTGNRRILIETKRADYYTVLLDAAHNMVDEPICDTADNILPLMTPDIIVTGDAVNRFMGEAGVQGGQYHHQSSINVDMVVQTLINGEFKTIEPDAFYIRDADVSQPKKHRI